MVSVTTALAAAAAAAGCGADHDQAANHGAGANTAWALPAKPDPGVREAMNGLFNGESVRAAAQYEYIYRCMATHGFHYIKPPVGSKDVNPTMPDQQGYGISVAEARSHGYGSKGHSDNARTEIDQTAGLSAAQKQAWGLAFFGRENGPTVRVNLPGGGQIEENAEGCLAEARIKIYGSLEQQMRLQNLAGNLPIMARQRADADPTMKKLNSTWSACMTGKGYKGLAAPKDARAKASEFHQNIPEAEASQQEIQLAVADASCESAARYAPQRHLLEDRYYTAGLHYFDGEIAALRELNEESLKRARQILQNG
ncbi:hypothetical protein [Actinoallomurus sp. CA-142502]|uniref:hypothetical protein n=1 Tax=Actinoallomurus sp. CA-142502 TaxID=3239885 RepID=UPI003D94473C